MQSEDGDNAQRYPADRLRIQSQPEEPLVRSVDLSGIRIRRLKNPVAVAGLSIDFVPPAQTDQSSASDILEIVEVDGQEDDGNDENEDVVFAEVEAEEVGQETCCGGKKDMLGSRGVYRHKGLELMAYTDGNRESRGE